MYKMNCSVKIWMNEIKLSHLTKKLMMLQYKKLFDILFLHDSEIKYLFNEVLELSCDDNKIFWDSIINLQFKLFSISDLFLWMYNNKLPINIIYKLVKLNITCTSELIKMNSLELMDSLDLDLTLRELFLIAIGNLKISNMLYKKSYNTLTSRN